MEHNTPTDIGAMEEKTEVSHEEVMDLAQLTPDERILEKKLRRRIDSLIMPLIILVYLMNYIDRLANCILSILVHDFYLLLTLFV